MATEPNLLADGLRPASFRGVPFFVRMDNDADILAGRRNQVHEYPQRDKPWVEDLGRATRELNLTGFVIGPDYVDQANNLLAALEEPGPGTLIHPWLGSLTVSLKDAARVAFSGALGLANFSLSFVEAGELEYPSAAVSTESQSRIAAEGLEQAAVDDFAANFDVSGFQDFVAADAIADLADMLDTVSQISAYAREYAIQITAAVSEIIALVNTPRDLALAVLGAMGLSGMASASVSWAGIARGMSRIAALEILAAPGEPSVYTPSRHQSWINAQAVNALARQIIIAQAVGASSLVATKADSTSSLSYQELIAIRDGILAAADQESMAAGDAVFLALQEARMAVWMDLTARARDRARLDTLTPAEVTPALVLAYDYYTDAGRDSEIVARNAIRHPGFVPAIALKVLTR